MKKSQESIYCFWKSVAFGFVELRTGGYNRINGNDFRSPQFVFEAKISVISVRPKIAELTFQVYGRPLHPELFECQRSRLIERNGYTSHVQITSDGHVVTWQHQGITLTEVAAAANHPLPEKRRLMAHRLKGTQRDRIECKGGITYEVEFALEPVEGDTFWTYQKELAVAGSQQGLLHQFESSGRFGLGAMSYIHFESRAKSLLIQAFHTFPDDCAMVKSQSVFRLPG